MNLSISLMSSDFPVPALPMTSRFFPFLNSWKASCCCGDKLMLYSYGILEFVSSLC